MFNRHMKKILKSINNDASVIKQMTNQTFYEYFSDCETIVDALMKITKYTDLIPYI